MSELLIPALAAALTAAAVIKGTPFSESFAAGAREGLRTVARILPVLIIIISASSMLRASGFIEWFSGLLSPLLSRLGVPAEIIPLALLRPVSGGGSVAYMSEITAKCGADSREGIAAALMTASTETTLYAVSIYSSGQKIKKLAAVVAAALLADFVSFCGAVLYVNLFC